MTNCMAQIKEPAFAGVKFIPGDHIPFHGHTALDHIGFVKAGTGGCQVMEEITVIEDGVFDHLCTAVQKNFPGKGIQGIRIAEYQTGLPESADQVFAHLQINGGFSTHRGINGSQKGGGHLDKPDSPQVGGSGKAGKIPHNSAAQSNQRIGTGQTVFRQKVQQFQIYIGVLAGFSRRKYKTDNVQARLTQGVLGLFSVKRINGGLTDQGYRLDFTQSRDLGSQLGQ